MTKLNAKDRFDRFVDSYVIDFNATNAAAKAGYSKKTARVQGSKLLTRVDIQEKIKKKVAFLAEKAGINQAWVLERYKRLATSDITNYFEIPKRGQKLRLKNLSELSEAERYCIKKIKPVKIGKSLYYELELESKFSPLHDLAQYTKLLDGEEHGDRPLVINQTIQYEGLSEEVIKKYGLNKGGEKPICTTESPSKA